MKVRVGLQSMGSCTSVLNIRIHFDGLLYMYTKYVDMYLLENLLPDMLGQNKETICHPDMERNITCKAL